VIHYEKNISSGELVWVKVFLENEGVNAKPLSCYVENRAMDDIFVSTEFNF